MKIERNKINATLKLLNSMADFPTQQKEYDIVFPIETPTKNLDGIELQVTNKESGTRKSPEAGIYFRSSDDAGIVLCDFQFARPIDFVDLCEILDYDLSKKNKDFFSSHECFLVHRENIIAKF